MKNNTFSYDGDAFVKLIDELVQLASGCNAGTSTFSAVRPDGWTVEISVKAPKEKTDKDPEKDSGEDARKTPPHSESPYDMAELLKRRTWNWRGGPDIGLTARPRNIMHAADINDVGTLCSCTESDLRSLRNFGAGCLREVKESLEALGLRLGMDLKEYGYSRPDWLEEYK